MAGFSSKGSEAKGFEQRTGWVSAAGWMVPAGGEKQELSNLFYNKWYSSHKVLVGTADEVNLGDLVNLNNLGNTYIVKGINMSYTEVQATPSVTIELVSNPKFE